MPDAPLSVPAFRAASAAAQEECLVVLRRHALGVGGPLGQVHLLTELLGSICVAVIAEAPDAAPHIIRQIDQLRLLVATAATTPQ